MKRIKIISGMQDGAISFNSNARTYGELKEEMVNSSSIPTAMKTSLGRMSAMVRETREDLTSDGARLPDDDFTLFLTQKESKAAL